MDAEVGKLLADAPPELKRLVVRLVSRVNRLQTDLDNLKHARVEDLYQFHIKRLQQVSATKRQQNLLTQPKTESDPPSSTPSSQSPAATAATETAGATTSDATSPTPAPTPVTTVTEATAAQSSNETTNSALVHQSESETSTKEANLTTPQTHKAAAPTSSSTDTHSTADASPVSARAAEPSHRPKRAKKTSHEQEKERQGEQQQGEQGNQHRKREEESQNQSKGLLSPPQQNHAPVSMQQRHTSNNTSKFVYKQAGGHAHSVSRPQSNHSQSSHLLLAPPASARLNASTSMQSPAMTSRLHPPRQPQPAPHSHRTAAAPHPLPTPPLRRLPVHHQAQLPPQQPQQPHFMPVSRHAVDPRPHQQQPSFQHQTSNLSVGPPPPLHPLPTPAYRSAPHGPFPQPSRAHFPRRF